MPADARRRAAPLRVSSIARGELLDEERVALGDADHLVRVRRRLPSSARASSRACSLVERAERQRRVAGEARRPSSGRVSSSSGRDERHEQERQRRAARLASVSMRSSRLASAQWMSSKTRIVGCSRATASRNCGPRRRAPRDRAPRRPTSTPTITPRCPATRSGSASRPASSASVRSRSFADDRPPPRRSRRRRRASSPASRARRRRRSRGTAASGRARRAPRRSSRRARELAGERRLADAGRPEDRDEVRQPLARRPLPERAQDRQLARRGRRSRRSPAAARPPASAARPRPTPRTGCSLPFATTGSAGSYSIASRVVAVGLLADDDAVDRRGRLQARRGVDDVAGDHRLAERRPRAERDDRLAGVDRDADLQVAAGELADAVADRRARRAPRARRRRRARSAHRRRPSPRRR